MWHWGPSLILNSTFDIEDRDCNIISLRKLCASAEFGLFVWVIIIGWRFRFLLYKWDKTPQENKTFCDLTIWTTDDCDMLPLQSRSSVQQLVDLWFYALVV